MKTLAGEGIRNVTNAAGNTVDAFRWTMPIGTIVVGMILWSMTQETYPAIRRDGFPAVVGTVTMRSSSARTSSRSEHCLIRGFASLESRDMRHVLIILCGINEHICFRRLLPTVHRASHLRYLMEGSRK